MRSILRTLPIRWQLTVLHATILALVLAAGSVLLWQTQRKFQIDNLITRHTTEARAVIPGEADSKVKALLFSSSPLDRIKLKGLFPQIIAEIFPPNQDPIVSLKMLGYLNPKLADDLALKDANAADASKRLAEILPQLGSDDLFPPGENPADASKRLAGISPALDDQLFAARQLDQAALRKWIEALVRNLSAKDRGVVVLALDGTVLAQSSFGPSCSPAPYVLEAAFGTTAADAFFSKLRTAQHLDQIEQGQLISLLPVIWHQDRPLALAQLCVPTDTIDTSLNQLAASLLVGWVLVVGLAALLGVTATQRVLRPLDQVVATTRRIAAGDLRSRVGLPPGRTEIAQLGTAFDAMVARLEEAFAIQRRFVADAAHELRTPLTALSASVELLLMGAADNDRATTQRLLRHLDSELSRVIRLTNDLLTLSRLDARPQVALCPTDLSALLEEVGEHSRRLLRGQELIADVAPGLWVEGDSDRLRQVVLNLLDNARKYTSAGGQIALRAYPDDGRRGNEGTTGREGDRAMGRDTYSLTRPLAHLPTRWVVVVEVEDTGVGIPSEALSHLFERFYRVDSARARASGGSGLGLAIVQAIVQAHHGQVDIRSTQGAGTCVTIRLPASAHGHVASAAPRGVME